MRNNSLMAAALTWRTEVLLLAAQAAAVDQNSKRLTQKLSQRQSRREIYNRHLVAFSGLFDPGFYLKTYPDVATSKQDPLHHYLTYGWAEARNPSALFDAALYLSSYDDVRAAGVNPLVHFITYGLVEGRDRGAPERFPPPSETIDAATLQSLFNSGNGISGLNGISLDGATSAVAMLLPQLTASPIPVQKTAGEWEALASERDDLERRLYMANSSLHRALAELEETTRKAKSERIAFEEQIALSHQERDDLSRRLYASNSDLHRVIESESNLLKIDAENKSSLAVLRTKEEFQSAEIERLRLEQRRLEQTRAELDEAKAQVVRLQSELEQARTSASTTDAFINELRETRQTIETSLHSLSENSAGRAQVDALLQVVEASATVKDPVSAHELDHIRDAVIELLRWPLDLSASSEFDATLFQSFIYKTLLASRSVEDGNLDLAYAAFSHTLGEGDAIRERLRFILFVIANWPRLAAVYHKLGNDASKTLFMNLLMFRTLGHQHVKLPSNTPEFWELKKWSNDLAVKPSSFASIDGGENIRLFRLPVDKREIELECLHANIFFTFGVNQYYYHRDGVDISPSSGDHVIDAGTCFGDTAVRMALSVGKGGAVYSFDPVHIHQTIAASNARRNKLKNIHFIPCGLSDREKDAEASDSGVNPGYTVASDGDVPLTTIDAMVENGTIQRVDFIKMDIEGSELSALRGAEMALRKFKPKLAISVYHKWEDYFTIAEYVLSLDLGYQIFMDNYTVCEGETILYCLAGA